jgi:cobyrinic acid a,c-diamide synthase
MAAKPSPLLVIAGSHSGVGKTTVTLALMGALRRRGLTLQPFKVGPDFIDPGHHAAVCGRISRNLDTWLLTDETARACFARASQGADVSLVEGVMGLYDGRSSEDPRGSTAHVAKLLDAPVVLVVDASGAAASLAAVVKGFAEFDPAVRVAAVLCNRVAGLRHYRQLESAIRRHTSVLPAGWLPRREDWHIPHRHLGLVTHADLQGRAPDLEQLSVVLETSVDVPLLLRLAETARPRIPARSASEAALSEASTIQRVRIGVARDAAFCFYYQDNLDLLAEYGADLVGFSPLADARLPDHLAGIYLGGGYPELHAATLADNLGMIESLQSFHQRGGKIYAECGGLMYCGRELVDLEGHAFPMLDLLPVRTIMQKHRAALGYITWRATSDCLVGKAGTEVRGHEYHYSRLEPLGELHPAAVLEREGEEPHPDGYTAKGLLAGYAHLHFASQSAALAALVGACQPA